MKHILPVILLCLVSMPAFAQDGDLSARRELSAKMHEIWPVRTRVEEALDSVAENMPEGDRASFKAQMRKAVDYKQLETESVDAMAAIYTEAELKAMIGFYSSPEGRAISAKTDDYMKALQPVMVKMLDNALLTMRTGGVSEKP